MGREDGKEFFGSETAHILAWERDGGEFRNDAVKHLRAVTGDDVVVFAGPVSQEAGEGDETLSVVTVVGRDGGFGMVLHEFGDGVFPGSCDRLMVSVVEFHLDAWDGVGTAGVADSLEAQG